eukprot:TRINITY_DN27358_c0_g1_i1.p1 TRINITY_DN27358_c0_g1~~TRINITY_DN27358_c0_g1_i1.p1  ORF type:complete len:264 (+),score=30.28 TRINITY_DN27358_c0_g1_i1:54-845(+)
MENGGYRQPPSIVEERPKTSHVVSVTAIRHGEGMHNVNTRGLAKAGWSLLSDLLTLKIYDAAVQSKNILMGTYTACKMRDPSLTCKGVLEANSATTVSDHPFDVIYVSPMVRTIETALIIFGRIKGLKIMLHPGCCETRTMLEGSNAGRLKDELREKIDGFIKEHNYEAEIDLSLLPEGKWWVSLAETQNQLSQRAAAFQAFLLSQPHSNVAVVSHATFLQALTGDETRLQTCQWKSYLCTRRGFLSCADGPKGLPAVPKIEA